jgi:hypothetical protein
MVQQVCMVDERSLTPALQAALHLLATEAEHPETLLSAAAAHYVVCPHRHETARVALTSAELRAAHDPYEALRTEVARVYAADLRDSLTALQTRVTGDAAVHVHRLSEALDTLFQLLASGNRNETLERWQHEASA